MEKCAEVYCTTRAMTTKHLSEISGVNVRTLERWCSQNNWQEERRKFLDRLASKSIAEIYSQNVVKIIADTEQDVRVFGYYKDCVEETIKASFERAKNEPDPDKKAKAMMAEMQRISKLLIDYKEISRFGRKITGAELYTNLSGAIELLLSQGYIIQEPGNLQPKKAEPLQDGGDVEIEVIQEQ